MHRAKKTTGRGRYPRTIETRLRTSASVSAAAKKPKRATAVDRLRAAAGRHREDI